MYNPNLAEYKNDQPVKSQPSAFPSISLPKGGGAIRGIDEKFSVNPANGTASLSFPLTTTPGRSGFGPALTLAYDSGFGNSPFGWGWKFSLPSISRKTDKGLPRYLPGDESDVFVLTGMEDLVAYPVEAGANRPVESADHLFSIVYYRPRIEGLFARIEKWVQRATGDIFWRSFSKDNILTTYGKTPDARLVDPQDPTRIFQWLIEESCDDKGNLIAYTYKTEDRVGIPTNLVSEKDRLNGAPLFTNRYPKQISYGNQTPGARDFHFQVVFDYGEHLENDQLPAGYKKISYSEVNPWECRRDPFSSYRAGFEIRTYRLCRRILQFHSFPELGTDPRLIHSSDLQLESTPASSRLVSLSQLHYRWEPTGQAYAWQAQPALEFEYSQAVFQSELKPLSSGSQENLPVGLSSRNVHWLDLAQEGLSGMLTEQADAWFFKSNLGKGKFSLQTQVLAKPSPGSLQSGEFQWLDVAGEGRAGLVRFSPPMAGYYRCLEPLQWEPFVPFASMPRVNWQDANLRLIDLSGDGLPDLLITEDQAMVFHLARGVEGFLEAQRTLALMDELTGPALVFSEVEQSVYLADMSGDGLTDIVRIRNGEICYWPNQGYGRFGHKITMDQSPWLDHPEQFSQSRIRLADLDGSGPADILYLGRDQARAWSNQSGNGWSPDPVWSISFPTPDKLADVRVVDLLGTGTACLVWSTGLPGQALGPLQYIELLQEKPYLLKQLKNNLGKETWVEYAPSTQFYLADKAKGTPWITRLPFPVQVVARVTTYDRISRNGYSTRYAYHHGYYDSREREFRGFGRVDQWDTESIGALQAPDGPWFENVEEASYVPPVLTKTWFHTGAFFGKDKVGRQYQMEYFGLGKDTDWDEFARSLLPDSRLPVGLNQLEIQEAYRSLKGSLLRQEVYAQDGSVRAGMPYKVLENNYKVKCLQSQGIQGHAVFLVTGQETLDVYYERESSNPRIGHSLILETDGWGNVLKSVAIGYGRLTAAYPEQTRTLMTYTENLFTNSLDDPEAYRTPLLAEASRYELTGYPLAGSTLRYQSDDFIRQTATATLQLRVDKDLAYTEIPTSGRERRLLGRTRTYYRADLLNGLLQLGELEALALPGESYHLALTAELLQQVFQRPALNGSQEALIPDPQTVLPFNGVGTGGYRDLEGQGTWWVPSGRIFYSSQTQDDPAHELTEARNNFFLPRRICDPFGNSGWVDYDPYALAIVQTLDAVGNCIQAQMDYRVMQPAVVGDANKNQTAVSFDIMGQVAGIAVMGKVGKNQGDSLAGFFPELAPQQIRDFFTSADPHLAAEGLLGNATTRIIYDLDCYRTSTHPVWTANLTREVHASALQAGQKHKIQIEISYSDGFGRVIQKKIQAEPEDKNATPVLPRWVGSGWVVFNNKAKPVKQYEPFFSATHVFEFAVKKGISPTLFYDPLDRVVAILHPNHTYEKTILSPWEQRKYDVNDTLNPLEGFDPSIQHTPDPNFNPANDPEVGIYIKRLLISEYLPTWLNQRMDPLLAAQAWQDPDQQIAEKSAAQKALRHANTPTTIFMDCLGRSFLTMTDNGRDDQGNSQTMVTRLSLDVLGNSLSVQDALGRMIQQNCYDLLKHTIYQTSVDAGERWMIKDVSGQGLRIWDSRKHMVVFAYDALHRLAQRRVSGGDGLQPLDHVVEKVVYGEGQSWNGQSDTELNLRGRVFIQYDQAGMVLFEKYDFKGNPLRNQRRLAREYKQTVNWSVAKPESLVEDEVFATEWEYDALNRVTQCITPDGSMTSPSYNDANLLERVFVDQLDQGQELVSAVEYDEKGRRYSIDYGNGVRTSYDYDPTTFQLRQVCSRRADGSLVQDLRYTYDPIGNVTQLEDRARPTSFFGNVETRPVNNYTYDPLYRLIQADGREHVGQSEFGQEDNWQDLPFLKKYSLQDPMAWRNYRQTYGYDAVGKLQTLQHIAPGHGWTREFNYQPQNNRLQSVSVDPDLPAYTLTHHAQHGFIQSLPHLQVMEWNFNDALCAVSRQRRVNGKIPETTYYVYDASGQRVRKVTENEADTPSECVRKNERIYLGGVEIYREQLGIHAGLERKTLHVWDDKTRVALIETRNEVADGTAEKLLRYQMDNHLGSACLELSELGELVSYEEYHPYGTTAYQAVNQDLHPAAKRYRNTGKERDEESGFYYHGARYYAPWLGRWTSVDPVGIKHSTNLYEYAKNNPVVFFDEDGREPRTKLEIGVMTAVIREIRKTGKGDAEQINRENMIINAFLAPAGNISYKASEDSKQKDEIYARKSSQNLNYDPYKSPAANQAGQWPADQPFLYNQTYGGLYCNIFVYNVAAASGLEMPYKKSGAALDTFAAFELKYSFDVNHRFHKYIPANEVKKITGALKLVGREELKPGDVFTSGMHMGIVTSVSGTPGTTDFKVAAIAASVKTGTVFNYQLDPEDEKSNVYFQLTVPGEQNPFEKKLDELIRGTITDDKTVTDAGIAQLKQQAFNDVVSESVKSVSSESLKSYAKEAANNAFKEITLHF